MLISLPSARRVAARAVGVGILTAAMMFGAPRIALADLPHGRSGFSGVTQTDLGKRADLGRVALVNWGSHGGHGGGGGGGGHGGGGHVGVGDHGRGPDDWFNWEPNDLDDHGCPLRELAC